MQGAYKTNMFYKKAMDISPTAVLLLLKKISYNFILKYVVEKNGSKVYNYLLHWKPVATFLLWIMGSQFILI